MNLLCIVHTVLQKENVKLKIAEDYLLNNTKALPPAFDEDSARRHPVWNTSDTLSYSRTMYMLE